MPIFGIMFPIFRALLLLQRCRQEEDLAPYIVTNRAGDGLECRPLRWVSSGTIGLSSSGASPKKTLYGTICDLLPCLLVIAGTGGWRYKTGGFDVLDDPQGFTSGTRLRTVSGILETPARLRRTPLPGGEVGDRLYFECELDEIDDISMLARVGPVSSGLAREIVKGSLQCLFLSRGCQTALGSSVDAKRFECFETGGLVRTIYENPCCMQPGRFDSVEHLLKCNSPWLDSCKQEDLIA